MHEKRDQVLGLKVSAREREAFIAAATRLNLSVPAWMRAVLMKSLLVDPREPEGDPLLDRYGR